jgi:hypothetical protein
MQRRWLGLLALVATALGSACWAPKWMGNSLYLSGPSGASVLLNATAGGSRVSYLRLHSLENGALLASVRFFHDESRSYRAECEPALPGRLWCVENSGDPLYGEGLRVRDAESLQIIAVQRQMLGGIPELAGTPRLKDMRVDPRTRGFVFESRDGYAWIIDPTTLAPARFDGDVASIPKPDHHSPSTDTGYEFVGGTRKTLVRHGVRLHPERTYLNGRIVRGLDDPPRVLVLEDVVDHDPTLWCLSADATAEWKVTDLPEVLLDTKLHRDTLVLVTSPRLIAVRTRDGAVVWSSPP